MCLWLQLLSTNNSFNKRYYDYLFFWDRTTVYKRPKKYLPNSNLMHKSISIIHTSSHPRCTLFVTVFPIEPLLLLCWRELPLRQASWDSINKLHWPGCAYMWVCVFSHPVVEVWGELVVEAAHGPFAVVSLHKHLRDQRCAVPQLLEVMELSSYTTHRKHTFKHVAQYLVNSYII